MIKRQKIILLISLVITFGNCALLRSQNVPCSAIHLAVNNPDFQTFSTNGLNNSGVPTPACVGNVSNDIWFEVTSTATGYLNFITLPNSLTDMAMAIYTGSCNNLEEIACSTDDHCGNSIMPIIHFYDLLPGTTYYIRLWNELGGSGTFDIQVLDYTPTPPILNLIAVDDAVLSGTNCVQLTPAQNNQRGCAWDPDFVDFSQPISNTFSLNFGTLDGPGADGICLVYQIDPNGLSACGIGGGGIASSGILNSFIIEFDTWDNGAAVNDIAPDHVAVSINGNLNNPINGPFSLGNIEDGNDHIVLFTWDPATNYYEVTFDGNIVASGNYDIINNCFGGNSMVYVGFTASTGGAVNNQFVCFEPPLTYPSGVEVLEEAETCETDPVFLGGAFQNTSGTYHDYYTTVEGCDSIITTELTVYPTTYSFFKDTICEGECLTFSGEVFCDSGPHQFTRTNQYNCDSIITLDITILYPVVSILPTDIITCSNQDALLDGSFSDNGPGFIYQWTGPEVGCITGDDQAPITTGSCAGVYQLEVFQPLGDHYCSNVNDIEVSIDTLAPQIIIAAADELSCAVNCITLDANASENGNQYTYQWTGPNNFTSQQLNPTVCDPGRYYLTIQNNHTGCSNIDSVDIAIDSQSPLADAGQDQSLTCLQSEVTLNAQNSSLGSNFEIHWEDSNGNILGNNPTFNTDEPGAYSIVVSSNTNGCVERDTVLVTRNIAEPIAAASANSIIDCSEQPVLLDGSASTSGELFSFLWQNNQGQNLGTDTTLTVQSGGNYQLITQNLNNGCADTTFVNVLTNLVHPNANAGTTQTIDCLEPEVMLNANQSNGQGMLSYQWFSNSSLPLNTTANFTTNMPGNYVLIVMDATNNCQDTTYVSVLDNRINPIADAGMDALLDCNNPITQIGGNNTSVGNNFLYSWTDDANQNIGDSLFLTTQEQGTFTLMVTDTTNGCSAEDQVLVTGDFVHPFVEAGASQKIDCQNNSALLNGINPSPPGLYTYQWLDQNGVNIAPSLQTTVYEPGWYHLFITNANSGCISEDSVLISQNEDQPIAQITTPPAIDCNISSVLLDASLSTNTPTISYQWLDENQIFLSNNNQWETDTPGNYSFIVLDNANGCRDTANVSIPDNRIYPISDAGADLLLNCYTPNRIAGGTNTSVGSNYLYSWQNDNNQTLSDSSHILVTNAGTYTLLVIDATNGCRTADELVVTEDFNPPVAEAGANQTLNCLIEQITLDAGNSSVGNNFTYQWLDQNDLQLSNNLTTDVSSEGIYYLIVTDEDNGCKEQDSLSIGIDRDYPLSQIEEVSVLDCNVTSLLLDGSQSSNTIGITYTWLDENATLLGSTNQLTIHAPGDYSLEVFNTNNGCKSSADIQVGIDTIAPNFSLIDEGLLNCYTPHITIGNESLNDSLTWFFTWQGENGNNLGSAPTLAVENPGLYELFVQNERNGCTNHQTVAVASNFDYPIADAGESFTLDCISPIQTLGGLSTSQGSDITYQWYHESDQIIANTATFPIAEEGLYTLYVENETSGCRDTSQVDVLVNQELPIVAIVTPEVLTCTRSIVPIDGTNSDTGLAYIYDWAGITGGDISTIPGEPLQANVSSPGVYQLVVTNENTGCADSTQVTVEQNIAQPVANAGLDFELDCHHPTNHIDAGASSPQGQLNYQWSTGDGTFNGATDIVNPVISSPGNYHLQVTDTDNGCTDETTVTVTSNFITDFEVVVNQPRCLGDLGQLSITNIMGGRPPFIYSIDDGERFGQQNFYTQLEPGLYPVVIQDVNGCELNQNALINPPTEILIDVAPQTTIHLGDHYQIEATVNLSAAEIANINWTPTETLSCDSCLSTVAQPYETTTYQVIVSDTNGCSNLASTTIFVDKRPHIYVPSVFSPNGDGNNDEFLIFSDLQDKININSFRIYSRWGELMFEQYNFQPNDPTFGWDGNYREQPLNHAVFVWYAEIEFLDGEVKLFKGDVVLIR